MASQLPFAARKRAAFFISNNGNNLQRMRYAYHFTNGGREQVLSALQDYQNEDGGYGHGLEHDLRTDHSTVICTTIALQIMNEVNTPADHPLITSAMNYLANQFQQDNWPLINKLSNEAPHAPWWQYDVDWMCTNKFLANPGAEILGYCLQYGTTLCHEKVNKLLERALIHLEQGGEQEAEIEMHELLCYRRLYHCEYLGENYREVLLPLLLEQAYRLVRVEPRDWEEYGLTPVDLVDRPDSPFADFFEDILDTSFEYQINQQSDEGCWVPRWSWGGRYPETWKLVETDIKAELTLSFLIQLKRFKKLA